MSHEDSREARLIILLRQAQNRLRNQGDVPEITLQMNLRLHDEIERELGGRLFLSDAYAPDKEGGKS